MIALLCFFLRPLASPFKSNSRLEAENAALRHQLTVLQRKVRGRVQFTNSDRLFFIQLYRWCPSVLKAMMIIRPETLVRWHRTALRRGAAISKTCIMTRIGGAPIRAERRRRAGKIELLNFVTISLSWSVGWLALRGLRSAQICALTRVDRLSAHSWPPPPISPASHSTKSPSVRSADCPNVRPSRTTNVERLMIMPPGMLSFRDSLQKIRRIEREPTNNRLMSPLRRRCEKNTA
jgi:hypothetical protein